MTTTSMPVPARPVVPFGALLRASACCMDLEGGRSIPNPVCGQAVRT